MISDVVWGALLGAGATLGAQGLSSIFQSREARRRRQREIAAIALINQDDFEHFQAMLARALDRDRWWHSWEQLDPQATVEDRKALWAALIPEGSSELVAEAQGWVNYLKAKRRADCGDNAAPPVRGDERQAHESRPLTDDDRDLIRQVFEKLECGRLAMSRLAGREFVRFRDTLVGPTLEHHHDLKELGIADIDCESMLARVTSDRSQRLGRRPRRVRRESSRSDRRSM